MLTIEYMLAHVPFLGAGPGDFVFASWRVSVSRGEQQLLRECANCVFLFPQPSINSQIMQQ